MQPIEKNEKKWPPCLVSGALFDVSAERPVDALYVAPSHRVPILIHCDGAGVALIGLSNCAHVALFAPARFLAWFVLVSVVDCFLANRGREGKGRAPLRVLLLGFRVAVVPCTWNGRSSGMLVCAEISVNTTIFGKITFQNLFAHLKSNLIISCLFFT